MTRESDISVYNHCPISIGGVGGSGTRVVAAIAKSLGVYMGSTVNTAHDNLEFVKSRVLLGESDSTLRRRNIMKELRNFEERMHHDYLEQNNYRDNWGWKVPGQFHLLRYTADYFPELKYIHVIRNGLDMAFSKNLNQLRNWGDFHGIAVDDPKDPVLALQYWISANQFAVDEGAKYLGNRFLLLNFDDLCSKPDETIEKVTAFISSEVSVNDEKKETLRSLVSPPASICRYKAYDYKDIFDSDSIEEVRKFGFAV